MKPALPYHLSESCFRFYEPLIKLSVENYPSETHFDLDLFPVEERKAPTTFVARFRDSIISLKRFKWETTVNTEKLWSISGQFTIWWESGTQKVWFKQKRIAGRPSHLIGEARERGSLKESLPSLVLLKDMTEFEIRALCHLLNNKRIEGPFLVEGDIDSTIRDQLMSTCDISIVYDKERNVSVIT